MSSNNGKGDRDGWTRLRFAVVGPLLASPPPKGRLRAELERLEERSWLAQQLVSLHPFCRTFTGYTRSS